MNPVQQFEAHVVAACTAKVTDEVRQERLDRIAEAIAHYVKRLRHQIDAYDAEQRREVERSLAYLDGLALKARQFVTSPQG